jgi:uncharacterized protein
MTQTAFRPDRLDVRAFAQDAAQIAGDILLSKCERLAQDLYRQEANFASNILHWQARGESMSVAGGAAQSWLHLEFEAHVPLQCQRCLLGMQHSLQVQRSFRFVRDEAEALAQDDEAQEDVLVASKQFDLLELIEDEIIMALPFVPLHDTCPVPVKLQVSSPDYEAALNEKPKAFAALGELKSVLKKATQ